MKRYGKMHRVISLVLTLVMILGMAPIRAVATEADASEQNGLSLDSVAWEGLTYRDIFITNNKAYLNGFNDKTFSPFVQNTGTNTVTKDACYTGPYSLAAFGSTSQQIKSVDTLPVGEYFVASKVYCTRYVAGELGVCLYSTTVGVTEVTEGFVTAAGIVSASTAGKIFIGSIHSADLDGYVDDTVVIDMSIFTTRPTEAELTALYETYVDLEKAIEREEVPYTEQEMLDAFVDYMNRKAASIGMENSDFSDPVGMDNLTTAYDLMRLMVYAYSNYEDLNTVWGTDEHTISVEGISHREYSLDRGYFDSPYLEPYYHIIGAKSGSLLGPKIYNFAAILEIPNSDDKLAVVAMYAEGTHEGANGSRAAVKQAADAAMIKYNNPTADNSAVDVCCQSAIVCLIPAEGADLNNLQILYSKDADIQRSPASISKVLTAICVLDLQKDLSENITYKMADTDIGGFYTNDFVPGESVTYENALYALMLKSSNVTAMALARSCGNLLLTNDHTHAYTPNVTSPTCTEAGFTTYTCECGESYVDDYVDATGHTYENGFCTVCGKQKNTTASPIDEGMFATVTPENYLTISNPTMEKLACAPGLVTYGNGKMAVAYLADDINTVETESSTTIVCRLGLFDLNSPQNGIFLDIATAGQTIGDVTIGQKAPYEPNLLVLENGKLMVLFNIRDTSGNYIYFSAMVDPESKTVTDYTPLTLDGKTWNPANIAASYNAIADNSIRSSGPSSSMVFTSQIVNHGGYYYGYCGGICAGFSGILVRSTDGVNWTSVMAPEALPEMAGVIECGFQFFDDYIYFCMRDISSGVYQCSYNLTAGEQMVRTHKLSNLTTSKPTAFTQNGKLYLIVNKATGDDATIGRRNTALFYEVDPAVCRLTLVRQIFCADGCAYHSVVNVNGTNYWAFHTDARRINPYTQGRSNLAFLAVPTLYSHTYESVVTAPTCTEQGYTTYTCTLCGDRYVDSYVEAVGHRYESNICIGCGKVKSGILNLTDYSHMYASGCITVAANVWQTGVVNYHYQIPLADFVSYNQVTVAANSTNKSYIAFFTQRMTKAGEILYADGWSEVLIMDPGATQTLKIPADAQYMYILNNNAAGDSLLPESVVFSCSHTYSDGICTGCGAKEPVSYTPGDITGDGELNNKDVTRLFKYLSNYDVEVVEAALDVNGDGEINNKDLTRLFRYLSGHDVTIN